MKDGKPLAFPLQISYPFQNLATFMPARNARIVANRPEPIVVRPPKPLLTLAVVFFVIWILIGIYFLLVVLQQMRAGAFKELLQFGPQKQPTPQVQEQTEATLPGIGKVNIACIQSALSSEAIQKILQDQGTQNLAEEEKTKLEPCIIEKIEASPQASPQE